MHKQLQSTITPTRAWQHAHASNKSGPYSQSTEAIGDWQPSAYLRPDQTRSSESGSPCCKLISSPATVSMPFKQRNNSSTRFRSTPTRCARFTKYNAVLREEIKHSEPTVASVLSKTEHASRDNRWTEHSHTASGCDRFKPHMRKHVTTIPFFDQRCHLTKALVGPGSDAQEPANDDHQCVCHSLCSTGARSTESLIDTSETASLYR